MQQPSSIPFYYTPPGLYNQDGGGAAAHQWIQENSKQNQYAPQWDSGNFHVTSGNNYGPSQVQGGGGQNRVPVGPQQAQQPSQPTPTSTPPGIHGDMNKQNMMQNQSGPIAYVQTRQINPSFPQGYPSRAAMTQTGQLRGPNPRTIPMAQNFLIPGMLTPAPTPTIVQTVPYSSATVMYGQTSRQGAPPFGQSMYVQHGTGGYYHPSQQYYPSVISQPTFPGMSSGGPSPQAGGQQVPMPLMRPVQQQIPSAKQVPKKRPNALKIIDPDTHEEVELDSDNNNTPTRSNDSSARQTPQPNTGVSQAETVIAEFAAKVARIAATEPSTPPSDQVQDSIASDSDVHHKQQPLVPSSEKAIPSVLSTLSKEFIPRSHEIPQPCEPAVEEERTSIVPTVSAETNSPAIEIQRPKEQFPALKNPVSNPVVLSSPVKGNSKKQKSSENERQQAISVPSATEVSPVSIETKDTTIPNNKKGPKSVQKEEIPQLPKEKREKTRSVSKEQSPAPSPVTVPVTPSLPEAIPEPVVKPAPSAPTGMFMKDVIVKNNNVVTPTTVAVEEPPLNVTPVSNAPQHQNGEVPVPEPLIVNTEGNKTSRQKNKKSGKMRDLNRKGVEKEGSEMDAFTVEAISSEDKERPPTPISPPPTAAKITPTPPPPAVELAAVPSPVDKIQEDLEEKEEKLVAAKNEENAKVSALSNAEEDPEVIEKTATQITLKRSYKKDQWSPLNQEGKKKYDREFLMELKTEPQSQLKPDNLPDVVAVLRDSNLMRNQNMNFMLNRDMNTMMPLYAQRSSQGQRGGGLLPGKRGSQQGNKGKSNPKVIHMSLSLHEDVKLKTAENAWKPTRLVNETDVSEEQKQTEEIYKSVRGILNKLTPQKFDTLMKKFMALQINSEARLIGVINLIFEKAVDEPNFAKAYASMCKMCSKKEVTKENEKEEKVNFRKILITRCQTEFEMNKPEMLDTAKWMEDINNCTDPEKKKELQLSFEEKERQIRMKSVGNIRFIGELFKMGMLTPTIMHRCIDHLLQTPEEESLECLCKLLTTIGKDLEYGPPNSNKAGSQSLAPYFQRMSELAQKKDGSKVSSRVRFMLQDVIELRLNKWVPRREDNNPKTIEQINKEAHQESIEMTLALNQQPPRMNRANDRQDDSRKRGNRANSNIQSEDGWTSVSSSRFHNKYATSFDSSKMQNMIKPDLSEINSLNLGGSHNYKFNNSTKSIDNKTGGGPLFTSSNAFSALSKGEDRKPPPQSSLTNRRITPTPSIEREKERARMMQGYDNEGGHGSRGSSVQRDRPQPLSQPPSRDSSVPRQLMDNKEVNEITKGKRVETSTLSKEAARQAEEKWERQSLRIIDEYLTDCASIEDAKQDIEQFCPTGKIGDFIEKSLQICLEKKAPAQQKIGTLLTALLDYSVFSADLLVDQFGLIYENADDIAIDVPKIWELQAQVIVPILSAEKINFSHFKSACTTVLKTKSASKLLVPVLNLLVQEKGPGFTRKVWDSSDVTLADFLPTDMVVDTFIKEESLDYLIGDPPALMAPSNLLSMDQVQEKMLRLMQTNQPFERILEFILGNVGDKVEDLHFIRALITAICEACITGPKFSLDATKLKQYEKLIKRFVDNKEDRELACLNSVHTLLTRLEHPKGLILDIFNLFLEDGLISSDSFLKWKDDGQEKVENKGVSVYGLRSFFAALEEVETDDENS